MINIPTLVRKRFQLFSTPYAQRFHKTFHELFTINSVIGSKCYFTACIMQRQELRYFIFPFFNLDAVSFIALHGPDQALIPIFPFKVSAATISLKGYHPPQRTWFVQKERTRKRPACFFGLILNTAVLRPKHQIDEKPQFSTPFRIKVP